jgi:cell division protein ZapA
MSSDDPKFTFKSVEVKIFNQLYSLRTNREVEHIKRIAGLVDERMRLISAHTTAHDLAKIAIFAALNIADELSDTREYYEREYQKLLTHDVEEESVNGPTSETDEAVEVVNRDDQKSSERLSWFEDIFDSPETDAAKGRSERLSSRVSAKLHSLRQPKQETSFSIEEDS